MSTPMNSSNAIFPCTSSLCQDDTGLAQEIDMQRTRRDLAEKKKSKLLEL